MPSFKDLLKYTPPDFSLFVKRGRALLDEANDAVTSANSAFWESRQRLRSDPNWGSGIKYTMEFDLVDLYGYWTMADDFLKRLERMPEAERKKHIAFDKRKHHLDYEDVQEKFVDLTARLEVWEESKGKSLIYPALDRQLKRSLDNWKRYLDWAGDDFEGDGERVGNLGEYCHERSIIEFAAMGIHALQMRNGRLEPLPYFDTFLQRRQVLDQRFKKLLNGRYDFQPWADPVFWWHHPPKKGSSSK